MLQLLVPDLCYLRRRGHNPGDAEDLTQGFFATLLERKTFRVADPERGKFRSFLLGTLKHFLSDKLKKAHAQKRGGGQYLIPLDAAWAEDKYAQELSAPLTDEKVFDRRWALTVLDRAVERLRQEYAEAGKLELFEALRQFQPGEKSERSYAETAARLRLSQSAIKSAIHRMRTRHRELLREEVAQTVAHAREVDQEIRYLISAVTGSGRVPPRP